MEQLFSNFAQTTLASSVTAATNTVNVIPTTGGRFTAPNPQQYEVLFLTDGTLYEVIHLTARNADSLSILRGQEDTVARIWPEGTQVIAGITKSTLEKFWQKSESFAAFNILNYQLFR
ncbi:MAG: hypothetical protein LPH21_12965 [Shewanella sp.]|nr:hypothetical protein [Shewanella sp.]